MATITSKALTTLKIARRHHHTIRSRLAIVNYATEHGIERAAWRFSLDRKTVPGLATPVVGGWTCEPCSSLSPNESATHCGLDRRVD
jgi:hypothetical protein